jgi:hypothetical protein
MKAILNENLNKFIVGFSYHKKRTDQIHVFMSGSFLYI